MPELCPCAGAGAFANKARQTKDEDRKRTIMSGQEETGTESRRKTHLETILILRNGTRIISDIILCRQRVSRSAVRNRNLSGPKWLCHTPHQYLSDANKIKDKHTLSESAGRRCPRSSFFIFRGRGSELMGVG